MGTHVVHATNVPTNRQFKAFRTCISSLLFNSPARTRRQDDTPCFGTPFKGQPSGRNLRATKRPSFDLLSFVDHAHPATPEPFEDAVMRNRLADNLAEILGPKVGQVNEGQQVGLGGPPPPSLDKLVSSREPTPPPLHSPNSRLATASCARVPPKAASSRAAADQAHCSRESPRIR